MTQHRRTLKTLCLVREVTKDFILSKYVFVRYPDQGTL